ncbi:hypothetical protein JMJ56_29880 [Belnapia sp. T18]|uniref:Uncharacterized protein n=1 Tax=Belnapia arida TaxID=2804533 RepID=A0ABS1UBW7_9PROT|nr:hypothetical protein [Belnapia arida]MBL6082190.1 hypothetical protein [Belnapia arida]
MALTDTAHRILIKATQHPLRLAAPPDKLPTAAARAVLSSLVKQGYVEECVAPEEYVGLRWHQQNGNRPAVRITAVGTVAIDAVTVDTSAMAATEQVADAVPAAGAQEPGSAPLVPSAVPEAEVPPTALRPPSRPPCASACATPPATSSLPGTTRPVTATVCPTPSPLATHFWSRTD